MRFMTTKKLLFGLGLAVGFATLAAGLMAQSSTQPAGANAPDRQKPLAAAKRTFELLVVAPVKVGGRAADAETAYRWSVRWMEAECDATTDPEARKFARKAHATRMQELEKRVNQKYQSGEATEGDVVAAEFYRLDAENWRIAAR